MTKKNRVLEKQRFYVAHHFCNKNLKIVLTKKIRLKTGKKYALFIFDIRLGDRFIFFAILNFHHISI